MTARAADVVRAAILVFAAIATHWPSLDGAFVYDDHRFVRDNARLASANLTFVRDAFVDPLATDPTGAGGGIYRPLRTIAYAGIRAATSSEPLPFHAASLALHALNAILAWVALRAVLRGAATPGAEGVAFAAALVFAAHPVQGEAVDWISSLDNLLFAAFALAALRVHAGGAAGWRAGALVAALYALALLAKEMAAPLPAILLVADRLARRKVRPLVPRYAALALVLAAYVGLRAAALGPEEFGQSPPWGGGFLMNQVAAAMALAHDALRIVAPLYPDRLAFDWQMPLPTSPLDPRALLAVAVSSALLAVGVRGFVRREPAGSLVLAFFLARLPASQMVFPLNIVVADRFLYLPLLFAAGALVLAVRAALSRLGATARVPALAACGAYGALLAALTVVNASAFASDLALWRAVAARDPSSFRAHHGLGAVLARDGRAAEAVPELLEAERLRPDAPDVKRDLGRALIESGFRKEGAARLAECVRLARDRGATPATSAEISEVAFAAGEAFAREGARAEAEEMLAALAPEPPRARGAFFVRRGDLRASLGDDAGARADWERALAVEPDYAPARSRAAPR